MVPFDMFLSTCLFAFMSIEDVKQNDEISYEFCLQKNWFVSCIVVSSQQWIALTQTFTILPYRCKIDIFHHGLNQFSMVPLPVTFCHSCNCQLVINCQFQYQLSVALPIISCITNCHCHYPLSVALPIVIGVIASCKNVSCLTYCQLHYQLSVAQPTHLHNFRLVTYQLHYQLSFALPIVSRITNC